MAKRNEFEKEERISRDESIALIDKEASNRDKDELLLRGASYATTVIGMSVLLDGITTHNTYMYPLSALIALGGVLLCKETFSHNEKTGYLRAVSSFLKANNGIENTARYYFDKSYSELTEEEKVLLEEKGYFEPATFSCVKVDNNGGIDLLQEPTRYDMHRFLIEDLRKNTREACKDLKRKVKTKLVSDKSNI